MPAEGEFPHNMIRGSSKLVAIAETMSEKELHGYGPDPELSALDAVFEVKEVLLSQLEHMNAMKKLIEGSDDESLPNLVTSIIDDFHGAIRALSGAPGLGKDIELHGLNTDLAAAEEDARGLKTYLKGVDKKQLAATFFDGELTNHMEQTTNLLTAIQEKTNPNGSVGGIPQRRASSSGQNSGNSGNSMKKKGNQTYSPKAKPRTFVVPNPLSQRRVRIKLPKIKAAKQLRALQGGEGNRRLETARAAPQCSQCDENDIQCNCKRLQECSRQLTWYDVATRLVGGYVSGFCV